MMRLKNVQVHALEIPLKEPYELSFGTIREIQSCVFEVALENGRHAIAEAVALPGYGSETATEVLESMMDVAPDLSGLSAAEARSLTESRLGKDAFGRSAILTAIDLATAAFVPPKHVRIPLAAAITSGNPDKMVTESRLLIQKGYSTIKVKIGADVAADIAGARRLLSELAGSALFRFDANKGYYYAQAERFLLSLDRPGRESVDLVEQPLPVDQWEETARLAGLSPVPIMLDESIYDADDICHAAQINVHLVKLKLFKHAGVTDVINLARVANSLGLGVILGNGVSTDIGNLIEAWVYTAPGISFHGASEGNGFTKLSRQFLANPPREEGGHLIWCAGQQHWDMPRFSV